MVATIYVYHAHLLTVTQVGMYLLDLVFGLLFRTHYRPEVLFKRLGKFVEVSFKDVSANKDTSSGYVVYPRALLQRVQYANVGVH